MMLASQGRGLTFDSIHHGEGRGHVLDSAVRSCAAHVCPDTPNAQHEIVGGEGEVVCTVRPTNPSGANASVVLAMAAYAGLLV